MVVEVFDDTVKTITTVIVVVFDELFPFLNNVFYASLLFLLTFCLRVLFGVSRESRLEFKSDAFRTADTAGSRRLRSRSDEC